MASILNVDKIRAAGGTTNVIDIDSSCNTTALTIDSSGRILTPAKPAFCVRKIGTQGGINGVLQFNSTIFNTGNHYDTTNHYFQATLS